MVFLYEEIIVGHFLYEKVIVDGYSIWEYSRGCLFYMEKIIIDDFTTGNKYSWLHFPYENLKFQNIYVDMFLVFNGKEQIRLHSATSRFWLSVKEYLRIFDLTLK